MSTVTSLQADPVFIGQPPMRSGRYVIGLERLAACLPELRHLHRAHWEETEVLYLDDEPIDPDYSQYIMLESHGRFVLFTLRNIENQRLVGSLMFFVQKSMHMRERTVAHEDEFFILRDHRGGRRAIDLLRYAESVLKGLGVNYITMSDKAPCGGPDLSKFLTRRDYKPVARSYTKKVT